MKYAVVLHTDDGENWGVIVPDLPGCFSAGDSMDDALTNVLEAIDLHIEGILEDGDEIPLPTSIQAHRKNEDYADGVWAFVDVDLSRFNGRAERVNITIPRRILSRIDDYVQSHGLTRSGFLIEAAQRAMR